MSKGISIHIGLNAIDPMHYGTNGVLGGCENDARAMQAIAKACNFSTSVLLTRDATSFHLLSALYRAAQDLESGDILLLTYAGHGAQVRDLTGDEPDGLDETWCLYDRMLLDDELYNMWSRFKAGVRIFVLPDTCHSGTATRGLLFTLAGNNGTGQPVYRSLDPHIASNTFNRFQHLYSGLKYHIARDIESQVDASVLLISACQDQQLAYDGPVDGAFTTKLVEVWNEGAFRGSYKDFHRQICAGMPAEQTPNYLLVGAANADFESQQPFSIEPAARAAQGRQMKVK